MDWVELRALPVDEKWYSLGLQLGIDSQKLNTIEQSEPQSPFKCKGKMLKMWLLEDPAPTWGKLINALYPLDEKTLANDLKSRWHGIEHRPLRLGTDDDHVQLKMETKQDAKITVSVSL